jgi:hypothetical protein
VLYILWPSTDSLGPRWPGHEVKLFQRSVSPLGILFDMDQVLHASDCDHIHSPYSFVILQFFRPSSSNQTTKKRLVWIISDQSWQIDNNSPVRSNLYMTTHIIPALQCESSPPTRIRGFSRPPRCIESRSEIEILRIESNRLKGRRQRPCR